MYFNKEKNRYFEWYKKLLCIHYARPKSARNILTNLSPNPARPENPVPTTTLHQVALQPTLLIRCMKIDVFYLRVICTCDQCDSPFCALQLTALIKPDWCVLLYCCACLCHSLTVVQPSWTTVPCPTTKLKLLISKSFVGIKQSVISVAVRTPLKLRLGMCIYKT